MAHLTNVCESCSVPISMIVNMSLEQDIVPDGMKLGKVIPVYKAKSITDLSCCSPISQNKLEKVVYMRLYVFVAKHEILYYMMVSIVFDQSALP